MDSIECTTDCDKQDLMTSYDHLQNWIHCICLVTFDIEIGQAIEKIYPSHAKLTDREKTNICYLSFPDSNSGCLGDTKFHFRTRLCPVKRKPSALTNVYNKNCFPPLQVEPCYFYGYVYFRQVKDKTVKRGYFQKSLVILSSLPLINFFSQIISVIAPDYFENGDLSLINACNEVDLWPFPMPGVQLNLPLMGKVFQLNIPHLKHTNLSCSNSTQSTQSSANNQEQQQDKNCLKNEKISSSSTSASSSSQIIVIPSLLEINVFRSLLPLIQHIQLVWELVLTCEPIIVMAPTPDVCSELVQSLISLILPLPYASDFRPFFTIHDSEFRDYTKKSQAPPPVILGVTNPFFAKTLQHWPHIIRICQFPQPSPTKAKDSKIFKGGTLKTLECKPGLYTKYKPYLQRDSHIINKLLIGFDSRRPHEVQNAIIRRYFMELTQSFLMPLERYMASLMPLKKNFSPFRDTPPMSPFNPNDFLKTVDTSGPNLTSIIKGDWSGLYKKFFRSPNFSSWYESRYLDVTYKLKAFHIQSISEANLLKWVEDKAEVEVVDLVLKIKEKLKTVENESIPVKSKIIKNLEVNLDQVINTLPPDVQSFFRK